MMMLPAAPSQLTLDSLQNFLGFFVFFWLLAIVLHHVFCSKFQWYQQQVESGAIQVSFGRLYLTWHYLNAPIQALGSWPRLVTLWRMWFICGVLVSSILILPVLAFLLYLFVGHIQRIIRNFEVGPVQAMEYVDTVTTSSVSLTAVVPGVNLPVSNMVPFFVSVLGSTLFHELGHGISAASEWTEVGGVGVAIIGVFPAAFVVIKNLDNQALSRQLRIMAAGVWHNLVLAAAAALFLWNLQALIRPFYVSGKSVTVVDMNENAFHNQPALFRHDVEIFGINNCSVSDTKSLERCCMNYTKPGFCLSVSAVKSARTDFLPPLNFTTSTLECCQNISSSLCFFDSTSSNAECLKVRTLFNSSSSRCNSSSDCHAADRCFIPYLSEREQFLIFNTSIGPLLFVGDVLSLLRNLRVSNYSRDSWLPLWLPGVVEMTLKYLVSISAALAVLNLVPCVGLDGQHFLAIWVELLFRYHFLPSRWSHYQLRVIQLITVFSSVLLAGDILLGFLNM